MITRVDAALVREAERFAFRFACESCAHFDADGQRCANGYPSEPHRGVVLAEREQLEFCKEFELV